MINILALLAHTTHLYIALSYENFSHITIISQAIDFLLSNLTLNRNHCFDINQCGY